MSFLLFLVWFRIGEGSKGGAGWHSLRPVAGYAALVSLCAKALTGWENC